MPTDEPVLLFDGVCNLCDGLVQQIISRDPAGRIKYAPLQSETGQELCAELGLPTDDFDSVVFVDGGRAYTKSDAAIRIAELLGWPYSIATVLQLVPAELRDVGYDFVADNRYDVFGKKDQCMVPDEDVSDRFLD